MKFLGIRDLRNKSSRVMKDLVKEKEIVITSNGKPVAILSSANEENIEEQLSNLKRIRAIKAVNEIQQESIEKETNKITLDEINKEINLVRKKIR